MKILRGGLIKRIHVDRQVIAKNRRDGTTLPHWTIQTSKGPIKCRSWMVIKGTVRGSNPEMRPLSCGARVYIETTAPVGYL